MKKNKVSPERIIKTIEKIFNNVLSGPQLKNLGLISIAIAKAKRLSINGISREIPTDVNRQKSKQTRLLRFLNRPIEMLNMMFVWTIFVLEEIYGKNDNPIVILIDGVKLNYGYKSFIAAIPFRKRAIPIAFSVYTDQQIRDMEYLSENYVIWNFIDILFDYIKRIMPNRKVIMVFDRGFSDEKLMRYIEEFGGNYVIRVQKNVGIITPDYEGKLSEFEGEGYFRGVSYNFKERIEVNLYCSRGGEEPYFIVSNIDDCFETIYRIRMQIEELFRDIKSLFGFKKILLRDYNQSRYELLLFLVIVSMGLLLILYEKSGYRWSKYYNTRKRKIYSLIRVIKEKLMDSWSNIRIEPLFTLDNLCFYDV